MKVKFFILCFLFAWLFLISCNSTKKSTINGPAAKPAKVSSKARVFLKPLKIDRNELVRYAKTFLGTPYKYGSVEPGRGLDCSGFVYLVFKNFKVKPPRVSKDYTYEGVEISLKDARPGDIILFTGSNNKSGIVGHMGIITENKRKLKFIHAASGNDIGVIISDFEGYYKIHFVKVIRVLI